MYSPGMKRPKPEFNHSPSSSAKVENIWSHTSTLSIHLHGVEMDNILLFLHSAVTGLYCFYSHVQTEKRPAYIVSIVPYRQKNGTILTGVSQICERKVTRFI